jgi:hypoxanthine-guanine phosphoribosyltransferase
MLIVEVDSVTSKIIQELAFTYGYGLVGEQRVRNLSY